MRFLGNGFINHYTIAMRYLFLSFIFSLSLYLLIGEDAFPMWLTSSILLAVGRMALTAYLAYYEFKNGRKLTFNYEQRNRAATQRSERAD